MSPPLIEDAFRAAMAEAGLVTSDPVTADGRLHRIGLEGDRPGTRNGWYVLHADPPPSGACGSWRLGTSHTWTAVERERLSSFERAGRARRADAARRERVLEEQRRHEEARVRAARLWAPAQPARADHAYLVRKRVGPGIARQRADRLVLPLVDLEGRVRSLQFISPDGEKRLLTGGRKKGHFIPVAGAMPGASRILISEGFATASTLSEMEPSAWVLAAVDAGNLEPVAVAVRRRWPKAEIVVCCDADPVGQEKGRAAAVAARALVAVPEFPSGVQGSDFNDLQNARRKVAR